MDSLDEAVRAARRALADRDELRRQRASLRTAMNSPGADVDALIKEVARLDVRISDMFDVEAALARALATRRQALLDRGGASASEAAHLARALARIDHDRGDIIRAEAATAEARAAVVEVFDKLCVARQLASLDTYGRRGAGVAKRARLDDAVAHGRRAAVELTSLGDVHAQLGATLVQQLEAVAGSQRMIDIWFDNTVTDAQLGAAIDDAIASVSGLLRLLEGHVLELVRRRGVLDVERTRLEVTEDRLAATM